MPPEKMPPRKRPRIVPVHAPSAPPVHPFDRLHATDTGGLIPGHELVTGHASDAHVTAYYAIAPSILDGLIDLWLRENPPYPIHRYTFLDVGAGKGRALMTASQHPFRAAVGVELNPGLAEIARLNLRAFAASAHAAPLAPASLLEGDALEVPLPEGPLLVHMFHPFEAPLLRRFAARLEQHLAGRPGQLDVFYVNAEHLSVLDRNPAFTRVFHGMVPMSSEDHLADLAEIAGQTEYGSTGDELCTIHRFTGRGADPEAQ